MTMANEKKDATRTLREVAESIAADRAFMESLQARTWKESEVAAYREKIIEATRGNGEVKTLATFDEAIAEAKAEGRYIDDVAPTFANVLAEVPAGTWISRAIDQILVGAMARALDQAERAAILQSMEAGRPVSGGGRWETFSGTAPAMNRDGEWGSAAAAAAAKAPRPAYSWSEAASSFMRWVDGNGARALEDWSGLLVQAELPQWHPAKAMEPDWNISGGPGKVNRFATSDELAGEWSTLVPMQRARWATWEGAHRLALVHFRKSPKEPFPVPFEVGYSWEPVDLRTFDAKARNAYREATRAAADVLAARHSEIEKRIRSEEAERSGSVIQQRVARATGLGMPKRSKRVAR